MIIDELEKAYSEFQNLLYKDDVNGKQIIMLLLKIQQLEQKLIYEMFYNLLLTKIINEDIEDLAADISCKINADILIDPIIDCDIDKNTNILIKKLKNKLNYEFDKFMLNTNNDFSDLCFFLEKYNDNEVKNEYWTLKNFLNKRFVILEENYETIKNDC